MNFICFLFRLDWALDYLELEASQIIIYLLFNVCVRVWTEGRREAINPVDVRLSRNSQLDVFWAKLSWRSHEIYRKAPAIRSF